MARIGRRLRLIAWLIGGLPALALGQQRLTLPSLDRVDGTPVQLVVHWFSAGARKAPAVALFHGCNGAYDRQGRLDRRMLDTSAFLTARGFHVLVVDSLTPRGETEICTQPARTRTVTQLQRRRDALAAIDWLAGRDDVDATRIGLIGWSNGGSTVLAATNARQREVADSARRPAFAVAFYPGCAVEQRRGYRPTADLLVLIGEADDWTPVEPCRRLVAGDSGGYAMAIEVYPGAYHGFDSEAPVRVRRDVPNGVHPGAGVHVGGDPDAFRRSRERLAGFIAAH